MGLPDPDDPQVWVHQDDLAAFMTATSIEAFPDPDNDGVQEVRLDGWTYDPCAEGADLPTHLDPTVEGGYRSQNEDTYVDGEYQPLVNLSDVKPGDFGELTLSFHLCDNPGYVWLQGALVEAAENGVTEPEEAVDTADVVELLDEIQTVWWYDSRGDNVLQSCEGEALYLTDSGSDPTRLFEVTLGTGPNEASLVELWPNGESVANFDQVDAIAATPNGDSIVFYDKTSGHLGIYDIDADAFTDRGAITGNPGGIVLAGYSPTGVLWAASMNDEKLYTVDIASTPPTATAVGPTGINLEGADLTFAADGTMYIWTADSGDQGLYEVVDPDTDTTAVAVDPATIGTHDSKLTGLAILDGGNGNLVGSDTKNDDIVVISRATGQIVERYPMTLGGSPYAYDFGDMTTGTICGEVFRRGTLRDDLELLAAGEGIPLDGNRASAARECFAPGVSHYVGFAWYVPREVGNEIQSDAVRFDLGFYAEQCRHNDEAGGDAAT
ncbi:MAG: hypothetical protein ABEJ06_01880 [Haloarculaceae archaeon]